MMNNLVIDTKMIADLLEEDELHINEYLKDIDGMTVVSVVKGGKITILLPSENSKAVKEHKKLRLAWNDGFNGRMEVR